MRPPPGWPRPLGRSSSRPALRSRVPATAASLPCPSPRPTLVPNHSAGCQPGSGKRICTSFSNVKRQKHPVASFLPASAPSLLSSLSLAGTKALQARPPGLGARPGPAAPPPPPDPADASAGGAGGTDEEEPRARSRTQGTWLLPGSEIYTWVAPGVASPPWSRVFIGNTPALLLK